MAKLEELTEDIRLGLGRGTRNPRDGYIDEILATAFEHFQERNFLPAGMTWDTFYETYYPKGWQGSGAQEGRNGIGPLVRFAQRNRITLPREVYEAWNLYNPGAKIPETKPEQSREVTLPPDSALFSVWGIGKAEDGGSVTISPEEKALHPLWGLPVVWVKRLARYVTRLNGILAEAVTLAAMGETTPNKRAISHSIAHLVGILRPIEEETGQYPEVSRRLLSIRARAQILVPLFSGASLSTDRLTAALGAFKETVEKTLDVFVKARTVTELLSHLRRVATSLYKVELEIRKEQKVLLGYGNTNRPPTPRPVALVDATTGDEATTLAVGAVVRTGDDNDDPGAAKAMLHGLQLFDGTAALDLSVIPETSQNRHPGPVLSLAEARIQHPLRVIRNTGSPLQAATQSGDDSTSLRDALIRHALSRGLKQIAAFLFRLNEEQVRRLAMSSLNATHGSTGSPCPSRTERLFASIAQKIDARDELAKIFPEGSQVAGSRGGNGVIAVPVPVGVPPAASMLQLVR